MKVIALTTAQKAEVVNLQKVVAAAEPAFKAATTPFQAAQSALRSYLNNAAGLPEKSFQRVRLSDDGGSLVIGF